MPKLRDNVLLASLLVTLLASAGGSSSAGKFFKTGQKARLMLSGKGFNRTGGGLLFNHPGNIATDGERLVLADRNNNRVLIWTTVPDGNVAPDLVLGQKNFKTNNPGDGRRGLNWPVGIALVDDKLIVGDAYNHRLLIWDPFPTRNRQAADLEINLLGMADPDNPSRPAWPWAVWSDRTKLVATATFSAAVLVWDTFPTVDHQPADLVITGRRSGRPRFGTPRTVSTDGSSYLVVGDHNANSSDQGNFFWSEFPNADTGYDYFMENPVGKELMWGGVETSDGRYFLLSAPGLSVWSSFPETKSEPDLIVGKLDDDGPCSAEGYWFFDGDGSGMAITPDDRLYISLYNSNKIVAYRSAPTVATACPDFAIGAPDIDTNTLTTEGFVTNPVPASDGKRLLVTSDFDSTLSVWKKLPKRSGQKADGTYEMEFPAWDNALADGAFVAGGLNTVGVWSDLPLEGQDPDMVFKSSIGSVRLEDVRGVALDNTYLYVADQPSGKIWGWERFPAKEDEPVFEIDLEDVTRLSSDGTWLSATVTNSNTVQLYAVAELAARVPAPVVLPPDGASWRINLPQGSLVADGSYFIADTNLSRVLAWRDVEDAIAGEPPDVVLGERDLDDDVPEIGKDKLFWPATLAYAGKRLWVGEFKFSHRLVEFRR